MLLRLLPATAKLYNYAETKPFSWAKPAYFDFSSSNFTVQDHILSTAGDTLKSPLNYYLWQRGIFNLESGYHKLQSVCKLLKYKKTCVPGILLHVSLHLLGEHMQIQQEGLEPCLNFNGMFIGLPPVVIRSTFLGFIMAVLKNMKELILVHKHGSQKHLKFF
jgi:hypothetical protein